MLERSTKRVFMLAINEASRLGHSRIEPHHLLLGIARTNDEMRQELFNIGLPLERIRRFVAANEARTENSSPVYSNQTRAVVMAATHLAHPEPVKTTHLLLALLEDSTTFAYHLLERTGGIEKLKIHLSQDTN